MRPLCILQAEDDENDIFLLKHAFREAGMAELLHVVKDGQEAIDYLSGAGAFGDRAQHPAPAVLILDLKMPRKTGLEVLEWVRQQPHLRCMAVIIFSSSSQKHDIIQSYELGANSFVVKPSSQDKRIDFARAIKAFWLTHNAAPVSENTP